MVCVRRSVYALVVATALCGGAVAAEQYVPNSEWHTASFELIEVNKSPEGSALKLYYTATDSISVTEADGSPSCGGGRWRDLYSVLDQDDNGVVRMKTEECGSNLILCVSTKETSTEPDASAPDDYGVCVPVAW